MLETGLLLKLVKAVMGLLCVLLGGSSGRLFTLSWGQIAQFAVYRHKIRMIGFAQRFCASVSDILCVQHGMVLVYLSVP